MATESEVSLRGRLSLFLVITSAAGVILGLGVIVAAALSAKETKDSAQLVLSSLLPLLGT